MIPQQLAWKGTEPHVNLLNMPSDEYNALS